MTAPEFIVSERLLADVQRAERIERRERFGERYVKTPELDAVRVRMQEWSNLQGAVWISLGIIGAERKKLAGAPGSETVAERFDSLLIELSLLHTKYKTEWELAAGEFQKLNKGE
jgi:hypothetical protein